MLARKAPLTLQDCLQGYTQEETLPVCACLLPAVVKIVITSAFLGTFPSTAADLAYPSGSLHAGSICLCTDCVLWSIVSYASTCLTHMAFLSRTDAKHNHLMKCAPSLCRRVLLFMHLSLCTEIWKCRYTSAVHDSPWMSRKRLQHLSDICMRAGGRLCDVRRVQGEDQGPQGAQAAPRRRRCCSSCSSAPCTPAPRRTTATSPSPSRRAPPAHVSPDHYQTILLSGYMTFLREDRFARTP